MKKCNRCGKVLTAFMALIMFCDVCGLLEEKHLYTHEETRNPLNYQFGSIVGVTTSASAVSVSRLYKLG